MEPCHRLMAAQRGTALMQTLQALSEIDDAFVAALEAEQRSSLPMQEREVL
jgi:antitoxin VapB